MKLLHISDLHIGKRVNEFNLLEDQHYILNEIIKIADDMKPQAILIAGDVYDKPIPSAEAVSVLDWFLTELLNRKIEIFMISGNHDSQERLSFGSRIMDKSGLHIAGCLKGTIPYYKMQDNYGAVVIYLLPFIRPAMVQPYFEQEVLDSYEKAVECSIKSSTAVLEARNIIVAHQFVTNAGVKPEQCESETLSLGSVDNVDYKVFDMFDYVALGHIHGPQFVGRQTVRYAGSPLKYSFSEARHHKSVTLVVLEKKGTVITEKIPLVPFRDMRQIKGTLEQLTDPAVVGQGNKEDYIHVTLTNQNTILDPIGKLRIFYPNIMKLDIENKRTHKSESSKTAASGDAAKRSPLELFEEFYRNQNNIEMTTQQQEILKGFLEKEEGDKN